MPRKSIARNSGNSGRVNVSGSELNRLGIGIGDDVTVDVAESEEIARALIESKDADCFLIVTPA